MAKQLYRLLPSAVKSIQIVVYSDFTTRTIFE